MSKTEFVQIEPNNEIDKILYDNFTCYFRTGYLVVGKEKICMPEYYRHVVDDIDNFEVRDTDIFIATHPKSGTTWSEEMVWMIINNLDFEKSKEDMDKRIPFIEFQGVSYYRKDIGRNPLNHNIPPYLSNSIEYAKNHPSNPRILKTHLPWSLLPRQIQDGVKRPKIIYVMRNAKDTCVSYYHHSVLFENYNGNFEDFCKLFIAGRVNWGPYWLNIKGYWMRRSDPNLLILTFEEMKKDLPSVIQKVAKFLNKTLSPEQIAKLADHLSFENMKKNPSVNKEKYVERQTRINGKEGAFIRSGQVGSYKADMSPEMVARFDEWIEENTRGIGFEEAYGMKV